MSFKEKYDELTAEYLKTVDTLMANKRAFDGVFGLGHHPKDDKCHGEYYYNVKGLVDECIASGSAGEADEFFEALIKQDAVNPSGEDIQLMFVPLQGLAETLLPKVSEAKKAECAEWYKNYLPKRFLRLPVQNNLAKALGIKK